jgi:integral membrane protein
MRNVFRLVALLEGVSYILLLFIAVPIKYWGGDEQWVKLLGMPHGLLFVSYVIFVFLIKENENWGIKDLGIVLLASILPFGTFCVEWKYLKKST